MSGPKNYAVMAQRVEAADALDFFPTPPWATRALLHEIIGPERVAALRCWEPAAGEGHMAEVLRESFADVFASDVHDYGRGYAVGNFVGHGGLDLGDRAQCPFRPDWIITNPPFNLASRFLTRAMQDAGAGVALLLRTAWLESEERWRDVFARVAPTIVAQFVERVPMVKGRWNPDASSATAYLWLIWERDPAEGFARVAESRLVWIPPGARKRYTHRDDRRRFAGAKT